MPKTKPEENDIITIDELAKYLRIGKRTIYTMVQNNEIPSMRIGQQYRFEMDVIKKWLKNQYNDKPEIETSEKIKVLIVDDNLEVLQLMKETFEDKIPEAIFHTAENATQALVTVGKFSPTFIILDIDMPKIDGIEVCKRLKDDPETNNIKIIGVSGHADRDYKKKILEAGAEAFISKPLYNKEYDKIRKIIVAK